MRKSHVLVKCFYPKSTLAVGEKGEVEISQNTVFNPPHFTFLFGIRSLVSHYGHGGFFQYKMFCKIKFIFRKLEVELVLKAPLMG